MQCIADLPVLWNGPEKAETLVILAHGAGAPMDSPFMDYFAEKLADRGLRVLRFEFPYMAERRESGKKRPPDRQPKLLTSWREIYEGAGFQGKIFIGGKSMGGRMASLIADELAPAGLICLGYPFYAPGKADKPRTEHLERLNTPALILQGERDSMGNREAVESYNLSGQISIEWLPDGNHDLVPRKASGLTAEQNWDAAIAKIADFTSR
ncbi:alpha/beta family hydrolase [Emcibacter nanhaiensis]|uniref:Alpha/beta hydrolase n=1 Tax=Emcibacter nanhaiensis TaxID=1505037 RepID=A0A501PLU3_9PROT|nr:alpha/beta family hydrolase [Emcibacter nanhaiensis]TPD61469.1 alpha/beta hydrolase [Emcibacter nanhaiensis]